MRLLLDTRILWWAIAGLPMLDTSARRLIEAAQDVYVSAASIWEVAIKARLGKLNAAPQEVALAIEAAASLNFQSAQGMPLVSRSFILTITTHSTGS